MKNSSGLKTARGQRAMLGKLVMAPGQWRHTGTGPGSACLKPFRSGGKLLAGPLAIPCVIGRSGSGFSKREGDGRTPKGKFRILPGYFRADRQRRPYCQIALSTTLHAHGWCDDVASPQYNRPIHLPSKWRHETIWREDQQYDFVLVLDYNIWPRKARAGSAIFFHVWREPQSGTEGCVAISAANMRRLLPRLAKSATLQIL